MRIAQITDLHLDDFLSEKYKIDTCRNLNIILKDIFMRNIEKIVITGDLGNIQKMKWLESQLDSFGFSYEIVLGNHDRIEDLKQESVISDDHIRNREYFFCKRWNGIKNIFLDTAIGCDFSLEQLEWLGNEISDSSDTDLIVIFSHHPILHCGTVMDQFMAHKDRDAIRDILEKSPKEINIFCGHYHFNNLTVNKNITQYVTPACIMQIRSDDRFNEIALDSFDFGYRIIEFSSKGISTETKMIISERKVLPDE